mmetsp:Transcript_30091/g.39615  ORF Transcript_30091/g.39615 Transcript_30091/m.39615 type:complete len:639 (-) Transcript_30091:210-2126(-)
MDISEMHLGDNDVEELDTFRADSAEEESAEIDGNNPSMSLRQSSSARSRMDDGSFDVSNIPREVYSLGQNSYGELGHGHTVEQHVPVRVDFCNGKDIVQVVAGNEFTMVLSAEGKVYGCGYNDSGQCGTGGNGRCPTLTKTEGLDDRKVTYISTANGSEHLLLVTEDGELFTCGYNTKGQIGHGTAQPSYLPKMVEALYGHRVTKVACSYYHSVIATDLDQVFSFGRNDFGQLGLGDREDRGQPAEVEGLQGRTTVAIACGQYHTVVGIGGGGCYGFGKNDYGQLGMVGNEIRIRPVLLPEPLKNSHIMQLACGYYHTAVLMSTGLLYTFGRNDYGQLGIGSRENQWRPKLISDLQDKFIVDVACGCYHTVVLSKEGKVYPFGRNNHGQLGTNTTVDASRPCFMETIADKHVCQVAAGFYHTVLLVGPPVKLARPIITNTLQSDLKAMLNNPARSDVTFLLEGKPLYAHRIIIMARCEPLERMLDGPMREAMEQEISIPDHRYDVFLAFLEFLYTDDVMGLDPSFVEVSFALDLLTLADQFLVEALKRKCETAIQKSITVENVSEMLVTADSRQAMSLRKRCFDFIMLNFGQVIATKSFSELPPNFLREICQEASGRGVKIVGSMAKMSSPAGAIPFR